MKLIRIGDAGSEKPAVLLDNSHYIDVSDRVGDFDEKFFSGNGIDSLALSLRNNQRILNLSADVRLGPPVARPPKIICAGLNYSQHARESGMPVPKEPVLFYKSTSAITGPNDPIILPDNSQKTDWEVELAIVVNKRASYISELNAMDYVGGYLMLNDVSEREFQIERGGQWLKGKSADSFAPIGPWLVTKDEIPDPHNLDLWLNVNGKTKQSGNTSDLIFKVPFLISYISHFMTLLPGDIVSTGTPSGVGMGFRPPRYLKKGDVVELGIDGLGNARQVVVSRI